LPTTNAGFFNALICNYHWTLWWVFDMGIFSPIFWFCKWLCYSR